MTTRFLVPAAAAALVLAAAPQAGAASYAPGRVIVSYEQGLTKHARASVASAARTVGGKQLPAGSRLVRPRRGETVAETIKRLRRDPRVRYAVPDYKAHTSAFFPNDAGVTGPGGWQALQWNFTGPFGVNAPEAWERAILAGAPGGRGVTVAVLDTGVAYENRGRYRRNPDMYSGRFTKPYDFVQDDRHPNDLNGHGTHVAGTIAQKTNNNLGLTGLAYGVTIMPLRVLDATGEGDASNIARAIVYAAKRKAQVINLSLEFDSSITASQIPDIVRAVRYAHKQGSIVIGAAGNAAERAIAYPARTAYVVSVGGTTENGCEADYSNSGSGLDVVAPGGGDDAPVADNPGDLQNCHPDQETAGRDIYQVTLTRPPNLRTFGIPRDYEGTSMSAPHVSAIAALIIATKVVGENPKPALVEQRLKQTARDLGKAGPDRRYGYGLVDAAAAINPDIPPTAAP